MSAEAVEMYEEVARRNEHDLQAVHVRTLVYAHAVALINDPEFQAAVQGESHLVEPGLPIEQALPSLAAEFA